MEVLQQIDLIWIIVGLSGLVLAGLIYALRQYQGSIRELQNRLETSQRNEYSLRESLHKAEKAGEAGQLQLEHER